MSRVVAIVEDEPAIRQNYCEALGRYGYQLRGYASRAEALAAFEHGLPDLVIIDVGLGEEVDGGFELCRELRARSAGLPIIFLTARDSDLDAVSGLRLGADDYLTKDISLAHLQARIATLFRRLDALSAPAESRLQRGELTLEPERMHVAWRERPVPLTVTEFWLVHALVRHPGHVKSRDQLMDAAQLVVDGPTINSHIKRVRRKFQALDSAFDRIETVYGMGYRWRS
ncbi:proteobacterial dedicated sortase system response regulator [Alkalilimnicola sp. S0819]|uniref:proteobacterial dedicated sortase system response regulator n=1 Tax=Alkalilimnicola sp. S0819 TaxID=2613922 RepID=UPI001261B439|nr:proteobacterial dedicated sortase system response regulator [Alkalilimnicola sp. S0819]KAB7628332.1 proteobacterial dedicated sortase system response regulator [Alkalilimnicola sp. S0819]MPQ15231.1 proteobacterial dedicated sortase system response regulator [Alkalilimnicola sp. S0819]